LEKNKGKHGAKKMRFQVMLEGAECLRCSEAGWQSVPDAQCSEELTISNRRTTQRMMV